MSKANILDSTFGRVGDTTTSWLGAFGRFWLFTFFTISFIPVELLTIRGWRRLLPQCFQIGTRSVPVVVLTGMFVGMVLVVQGFDQFDNSGLGHMIGGIVNLSLVSELGPVLAGVMLAGRVGGALTAELGTMNVTEQLLALRSMGSDPIRFLATPRFLACLVLTPILTCYANLTGAFGAWIIYWGVFGGESQPYWEYTKEAVLGWHLWTGLLKSLCFGGMIGLISCYKGFHCKRGAEGVGRACTDGFVASFVVILMLDLFLGIMLNGFYKILYGFRSLF